MKNLIALTILILSVSAIAGRGISDDVSASLTKTTNLATVPYVNAQNKRMMFTPSEHAVNTDNFGTTHTRYRQTHKGLTVIGADMVEHSRDGKTTHSGRMAQVDSLNIRPQISRALAQQGVEAKYGTGPFSSSLAILPLKSGSHLVWHFSEASHDSRWQVFVDAHTGKVLNAYNNIQHGTGTGVLGDAKSVDTTFDGSGYQMISADGRQETYDAKTRKQLPGTLMTDADDVWTDGAAVDAHHYAGLTLDYYMEQHGRDSWDGQGAAVKSTVHYDRNYVNAFWNGSQMVYGDGDGVNSVALSGGFDVVAHEITHAVTERTSGLIYQNESGALNEAFSDIMGSAAEYYKQNSLFDWKLGEDIWTPGISGDALRYMNDPTADGSSTDFYADRYTGTSDNGGVHWNSGIANLAYVLSCEGGSHPTYGGSYSGVGFDTATQVFFIAFTQYLSSSATFADARAACAQVALDNYGASVAATIDAAWVAVGVPDGGGVGGPEVIAVAVGDTFESEHPYLDNSNITWEISSPGATSITIDFSSLDMERNYDYVYVKDANGTVVGTYTSRYRNGVSVTVTGSSAQVNLVSDASVTKSGFVAVATAN